MDSIQLLGAMTPQFSSDPLCETMDHITRELTLGSRYLFQFIPSIYFHPLPAPGQRHVSSDRFHPIIYSLCVTA